VKNLVVVVTKPQSWIIALYGLLMYVPLAGFADLWGTPFLMTVYQLDPSTASSTVLAMYIGIGFGAPIFPLLCERFKAYKPAVFIAPFGALVFLSAVFYFSPMPHWLLVTLLFLAGLFLGGQFLAFSMTCALNPLSASATAGGFHNMICMLSGVIFQPFIGWLLDYSWHGAYVNGIRAYSTSNYMFALSSISISLFFACFVVLFIKEVYSK
jgi:MFS family permease